ncbi:K(+)-transporting ATPase subunit F [Actinotalea subterranea]|nr:K(+)-transporting ATPase subunit F [Actinotalea subterranea]
MSAEDWAGLVVAAALAVYLVVQLLRADKVG